MHEFDKAGWMLTSSRPKGENGASGKTHNHAERCRRAHRQIAQIRSSHKSRMFLEEKSRGEKKKKIKRRTQGRDQHSADDDFGVELLDAPARCGHVQV